MTSLATATAEVAISIAANPAFTLAIAFLVAAAESVVVFGALSPGTLVPTAIGALLWLSHRAWQRRRCLCRL